MRADGAPRRRRARRPAAAALLLLAVTAACAGPEYPVEAPWHRAGLSLGGALNSSFDTNIRLDSATLGRGTDLSFEDDLGLSSTDQVFRIDAYYRIDRRNRIDVGYFELDRSATETLGRDVQFGDAVIPIFTEVTSEFDTEVLQAAYRYSFWLEDDFEMGASLGLYTMWLTTGIQGTLLDVGDKFSGIAPLPVGGLHAAYAIEDNLVLVGSGQIFYIDLQNVGGFDIKGELYDIRIGLEYDFWDHLGVGVAYNPFLMDVELKERGLTLSGEYAYQGIFIYLRGFF